MNLQPAPAWTAIIAVILLTVGGILLGVGQLLNIAFPLGTFAVGLLLYFRYPVLYLGFTWWMWFLTPLIRRLADYRGSFTNPSPILLAPYLVTLITLVTLWQHLPKAYRQGSLPFVLSSLGVLYAFVIGLIQMPSLVVFVACLDWLVPVLLGFHLYVNWQHYPEYRQNMLRVFAWGTLIAGAYGVVQFLVAPAWDCDWLIKSGFGSGGRPEPLSIRVWGTSSSSGPFANFMRVGLLLLFINKGVLRIPASIVGYLSLLLTLVRSAWGAWGVGLLCLAYSASTRFKVRLLITILVVTILVVPLSQVDSFSERINERLETISSLEDDGSANAREEMYNELLEPALMSFVGGGIGDKSTTESAVLTLLLGFGWLGTIPYMGGLLVLTFKLCQRFNFSLDPFVGAAQAIVLSSLAQLPLGTPTVDIKGVLLWGFLGIGMAAVKYHQTNLLLSSSGARSE